MKIILQWIVDNKEWLFSGAGVVFLSVIFHKRKKMKNWFKKKLTNFGIGNTINYNSFNNPHKDQVIEDGKSKKSLSELKQITQILFIDDNEFGVDILKDEGWGLTEHIEDIKSLSDSHILRAHIIFVDINGVGKRLFPEEQGKGLAIELKRKYPEKKVILYSAENIDFLIKARKKVDDILTKNAEPIQFITVAEEFANTIHNG